jgi:hypothetical protein
VPGGSHGPGEPSSVEAPQHGHLLHRRERVQQGGLRDGGRLLRGQPRRRSARPGGVLEHRYLLLAEIGLWWLLAAAALLCVAGLPRRVAVPLVLGLAVAVRVAALADRAPLSDDLYRYAWADAVQHAGIDPYRYPPAAEQLRPLRAQDGMAWLWPPERAGSRDQWLINREGVPTIYPPVAQAWFALVHAVVPLSARDRGYDAVGLGLDLAVLAALLALLRAGGRDPRWAALYALTPLPVLESVQNAHVDVLAVLLALGALALAERRPAAAAAVLALAALVKVYPGVLLPLLLRRRGERGVLTAFGGPACWRTCRTSWRWGRGCCATCPATWRRSGTTRAPGTCCSACAEQRRPSSRSWCWSGSWAGWCAATCP